MPTYDYKCQNFEYAFETLQPMSVERLTRNLECEKGSLKRLIGSGLLYKGSGFYQINNRSNSYVKKLKQDSSTTKKETKLI